MARDLTCVSPNMTVPFVRASYLIEIRTGRPSQIGIMGPFNLLAALDLSY